MPGLGVNIDHVATIRQARKTIEPDPVWAAVLAELGGADGITIHLREDRRHIQDRDLRLLRQSIQVKMNLEMAAEDEITDIALDQWSRPPRLLTLGVRPNSPSATTSVESSMPRSSRSVIRAAMVDSNGGSLLSSALKIVRWWSQPPS